MAIVIGKKIEKVEFEIVGLSFKVDKSDDKLFLLQQLENKARNKINELDEKVETLEDIEPLREVIQEALDALLGEGAFGKIERALSDGDNKQYTVEMAKIFFQVFENYAREAMNPVAKYTREDE